MKTKTYLVTIMTSSLAVCLSQGGPTAPAKPFPTSEAEFKRYDENGDEKLTVAELSVDRKEENATKLLAKSDANKDGFLQLSECRLAMVWKYPKAVFNEYDSNKNGNINLEEFTAKVKKKDKAEKWFNSLDWDKNKNLSFVEFKKVLK